MPVSPSFILGRRLEPTKRIKPNVKPILTSNNDVDNVRHKNFYPTHSVPVSPTFHHAQIRPQSQPNPKKKQKQRHRPMTARSFGQHMKIKSKPRGFNKSLTSASMSISYGFNANLGSTINFRYF